MVKQIHTTDPIEFHRELKGKIEVVPKIEIKTRQDLSLVYTPGVGKVSSYIAEHKEEVNNLTMKRNTVAVVSDGSAVLGLGNIGPEAALPVMEGKCMLFKHFAGIDAIPIVLSTQDPEVIIQTVKAIAPTFGGINLEDISAPNCFLIEERLKAELDIPVVHDDQWGAAVATLAALINALKLVNKPISTAKIVVLGAGAAGAAIVRLIHLKGARNIFVCDRQGVIYPGRKGNNTHKRELASLSSADAKESTLQEAMKGADVFIGVSAANMVTSEMVASMNSQAIVFALANPVPEIMPDIAKAAGAVIVATGRSDYANQINNALVFPGLFRGALDHQVKKISRETLVKAAESLAALVATPSHDKIIPSVFDEKVVETVAKAVGKV